MPKPIKFTYTKKEPFRDASYFVIVCEGANREPDYFQFFNGMSSRVKIYTIGNNAGKSSPENLLLLAEEITGKLDFKDGIDQLWFVIDTDRWKLQIRNLRSACESKTNWFVAQSNPCFEVWLYFHINSGLPDLSLDTCAKWKPYIPSILNGGFNCDKHPAGIELAITNASNHYSADDDTPATGSTQVWQLASALLPLIKKDLDRLKWKFDGSASSRNAL